jgi:hypothetical protein
VAVTPWGQSGNVGERVSVEPSRRKFKTSRGVHRLGTSDLCAGNRVWAVGKVNDGDSGARLVVERLRAWGGPCSPSMFHCSELELHPIDIDVCGGSWVGVLCAQSEDLTWSSWSRSRSTARGGRSASCLSLGVMVVLLRAGNRFLAFCRSPDDMLELGPRPHHGCGKAPNGKRRDAYGRLVVRVGSAPAGPLMASSPG